MLIYKSFIASNFSYCPVVWVFCGKRNALKLEKLQHRALTFVFRDFTSSYDELLRKGNLLSLSMYRLRFLAIEVYKCVMEINPPYLNNLFTKRTVNYDLRYPFLLQQNKFSTYRYGYKSFKYYGYCGIVYQVILKILKICNHSSGI